MELEVIRIVTRCTTREQFISLFGRYCSSTSCFIPSTDTRPPGMATKFSIQLADGTRLLEGQGVVLDAWSHRHHRFKRPGVLLGIHRLDDDCGPLFELLLRPKTAAIPVTPKTQLQLLVATPPSAVAELDTPTVEMPPLPLPEEPRTPGSDLILPANPLTEMSDDLLDAFVECNLLLEPATVPMLPLSAPRRLATEEPWIPTPIETEASPVTGPTITYEAGIPALPIPSALETREATLPGAVPVAIATDPTIPNPKPARRGSRDLIATLIGMAPLKTAPQRVPTETAHRTPAKMIDAATAIVEPLPRPGLWGEPRRPRQRLAIADVTRPGLRSRIAARIRRWWLPATIATTIVSGAIVTSTLI